MIRWSYDTEVELLDQLLRESFHKHFSVRNFFNLGIEEVDGIINRFEEKEGKDFMVKRDSMDMESGCLFFASILGLTDLLGAIIKWKRKQIRFL